LIVRAVVLALLVAAAGGGVARADEPIEEISDVRLAEDFEAHGHLADALAVYGRLARDGGLPLARRARYCREANRVARANHQPEPFPGDVVPPATPSKVNMRLLGGLLMIPVAVGATVGLVYALAEKAGSAVRHLSGGLNEPVGAAPILGRRTRTAGATLTVLRF
jgi:hypothetical protein